MEANDRWNLASLLKEESLWEVYKLTPSFFSNAFNGWVFVSLTTILALCSALHLCSSYFRRELPIPFADISQFGRIRVLHWLGQSLAF